MFHHAKIAGLFLMPICGEPSILDFLMWSVAVVVVWPGWVEIATTQHSFASGSEDHFLPLIAAML